MTFSTLLANVSAYSVSISPATSTIYECATGLELGLLSSSILNQKLARPATDLLFRNKKRVQRNVFAPS
jgi:hypothetical protein